MLDADRLVLEVDLADVVVLVVHAHLPDEDRDSGDGAGPAATVRLHREDLDARFGEDLQRAGGEDAVALVPRDHS